MPALRPRTGRNSPITTSRGFSSVPVGGGEPSCTENRCSRDLKTTPDRREGAQEGQRSGSTHAIACELPLSRLPTQRLQHKDDDVLASPHLARNIVEWRLPQLPLFARSSRAAQNPRFHPVVAALLSQDARPRTPPPLGRVSQPGMTEQLPQHSEKAHLGATQNLYKPRAALKLQRILRFL